MKQITIRVDPDPLAAISERESVAIVAISERQSRLARRRGGRRRSVKLEQRRALSAKPLRSSLYRRFSGPSRYSGMAENTNKNRARSVQKTRAPTRMGVQTLSSDRSARFAAGI